MLATLAAVFFTITSAQVRKDKNEIMATAAMKRFPGFTTSQMVQLIKAGKQYSIPLPTWIPTGFKAEKVVTKIDAKVPLEDQELYVIYTKALPGGKKQGFIFEAGIEGIGDLLYEHTHIIQSKLGEIELCYEPKDEEGKKKLKHYVRTQWFQCDSTSWAFGSGKGMSSKKNNIEMVSLEDAKKILASLEKL